MDMYFLFPLSLCVCVCVCVCTYRLRRLTRGSREGNVRKLLRDKDLQNNY